MKRVRVAGARALGRERDRHRDRDRDDDDADDDEVPELRGCAGKANGGNHALSRADPTRLDAARPIALHRRLSGCGSAALVERESERGRWGHASIFNFLPFFLKWKD